MGILYCVPECHVEFNAVPVSSVPLKPAGLRIICEACNIVKDLPWDVGITSGTEGQHSGPTDPHPRGEAIDFMTHNFRTMEEKYSFASSLAIRLNDGLATRVNGHDDVDGWAGAKFFVFVEHPGQPKEHVHAQVRKGCQYP